MIVAMPSAWLAVYAATLNWRVLGTAGKLFESSEVLPPGSVAVALTNAPAGTLIGKSIAIGALPAASVVTVVVPSGVWPWPKPERSAVGLVKNCRVKVVPGVLLNDP